MHDLHTMTLLMPLCLAKLFESSFFRKLPDICFLLLAYLALKKGKLFYF